MKLVALSKGHVAMVDDDDFETVSRFSWYARRSGNGGFYATATACVDGKKRHIQMHRLIMNPSDHLEVHHVDGNGLNNRRANLVICSHAENNRAFKPVARGISRFRGVSRMTGSDRWRARININGAERALGVFATEDEAARAYDRAALELFGPYAHQNFPATLVATAIDERAAQQAIEEKRASALARRHSSTSGVTLHRKSGLWRAYINSSGRQVSLGYFRSEEAAIKAVTEASASQYPEMRNWNHTCREGKTSLYRGVFWSAQRRKWCAHITIARKRKYLGFHVSEEEAARAYDAAARIFFGLDAQLNFPETLISSF